MGATALTPDQVELLRADFAPLAPRDADLPDRLLAYVLEGRDSAALEALGRIPDSLEGLRMCSIFFARADRPRHRLFQSLESPPVDLLLRLAHVYEAAVRTPPPNPNLRLLIETRPRWLGLFLVEVRAFTVNCWPHQAQLPPWLTWALLEDMLAANGEPRDSVVLQLLIPDAARDRRQVAPAPLYLEIPGFPEACARHANAALSALLYPHAEQIAHALRILADGGADAALLAPRLVELATTSGKAVAGLAEVLLRRKPAPALPLLEGVATKGRSAEERRRALRLMAEMGGPGARAFLEQRRVEETKAPVVKHIEDLLAAMPAPNAQRSVAAALAPIPPLESGTPLSPAARDAFNACVDVLDSAIAAILARPDYAPHGPRLQPITAEERQSVLTYIGQGRGPRERGSMARAWYCGLEPRKAILAFLAHPDLALLQAVRFLTAISILHPGSDYEAKYGLMDDASVALTHFRRRHDPFGFRELAQSLAVVGGDGDAVGRHVLRTWRGLFHTWEADAQWPYFAERLHILVGAFEPSTEWIRKRERLRALGALSLFPTPPTQLVPTLWTIALGPVAKERNLAQAALARAQDAVSRVIAALGDARTEVRAIAAEWLGRLQDSAAIAPLHAALKGERRGAARAAMLLALESLGEPVDAYLDREALLAEARTTMKKATPEAISWFPFERLPALRWRDTGEEVAPEIVHAWLIEAHALKTPEPGPLLRRYTAMLHPQEREALGQLVIDAWIEFDVRPATESDARRQAERETEHFLGPLPAWAEMVWADIGYDPERAREEAMKARVRAILKTPVGSAAAHRGVLALAAACAGAGAAPAVHRYLKDWYGQRSSQCKALLQMLAWIEHPSATQLVLSIAERFRTKGIQQEARRLSERLAEEHGWTVEELADRSVPDAGLDARGVLPLDWGGRFLTARLMGEDLLLFDRSGALLSKPPKPRKDDEADATSSSRRTYTDARKEVKATVALQKRRLYEALCTERRWRALDWRRFVLAHPITGPLARRLVWAVSGQDGSDVLVRAREDGSFAGLEDSAVVLPDDAWVRVAHATRLTAEARAAWERCVDGQGVPPLFDQFSRPPFALADSDRDRTDARDLEGHVLNGLALRRKLMDLGYLRGPFQGHTWFNDYRKPFDAAGMEAVILFSGASLNDEDRPVAILGLSFSSLRRPEETGEWYPTPLTLGEVPKVLLSECWNDARAAAALGKGFDPNWRKTVA
ncbi:MAG: DUF4132 domain-containing protein [Vicinamibacteria bacterium]|nr:DUF4132 domain-containing protein [Vicinamibacteria bacterium]